MGTNFQEDMGVGSRILMGAHIPVAPEFWNVSQSEISHHILYIDLGPWSLLRRERWCQESNVHSHGYHFVDKNPKILLNGGISA